MHSRQTVADDLLGFLGKSSTIETDSQRYRWRLRPARRRRSSAVVSTADVWVDIASKIRRRGTAASQLSISSAYRHMLPTTVDQPRCAGELVRFAFCLSKMTQFAIFNIGVVSGADGAGYTRALRFGLVNIVTCFHTNKNLFSNIFLLWPQTFIYDHDPWTWPR